MNQENENPSKSMNFYRLQKSLVIDMAEKYNNTSTEAANNIVIDAAKSASKRLAQKTAEATGDRIGNTIINKTTSAGRLETKESSQNNGMNETQEIYIPSEKRQ